MIRVDTVTSEDISKILTLYQEICGGCIRYINPQEVCAELKSDSLSFWNDGHRIGSRWDGNSKLRFDVKQGCVVAVMDENFDPRDRHDDNPRYCAALAAAEQFRKAVLAL